MKISTRGRYGLRAMAYIAEKSREGVGIVSARSVAESQGISENYLEQIIAALKQGGLLNSARGAGGGYTLTKSPGEITAGAVLRAVEGSLSPAECVSGGKTNKNTKKDGCVSCDNCAAKSVLERVFDSVNETVDAITIQDLINNNL
ncbi:MAG: Rrf2 family transcriptional regulator [Clostridiales bacterium]|nr:Rrf2 family transcriptional regulator [Clostridiales bacterium]